MLAWSAATRAPMRSKSGPRTFALASITLSCSARSLMTAVAFAVLSSKPVGSQPAGSSIRAAPSALSSAILSCRPSAWLSASSIASASERIASEASVPARAKASFATAASRSASARDKTPSNCATPGGSSTNRPRWKMFGNSPCATSRCCILSARAASRSVSPLVMRRRASGGSGSKGGVIPIRPQRFIQASARWNRSPSNLPISRSTARPMSFRISMMPVADSARPPCGMFFPMSSCNCFHAAESFCTDSDSVRCAVVNASTLSFVAFVVASYSA